MMLLWCFSFSIKVGKTKLGEAEEVDLRNENVACVLVRTVI